MARLDDAGVHWPNRNLMQVFAFNRQEYKKAIEKLNQANDRFDSKSRAEGGNYAEALVYRGRAEQSLGLDKEAWLIAYCA